MTTTDVLKSPRSHARNCASLLNGWTRIRKWRTLSKTMALVIRFQTLPPLSTTWLPTLLLIQLSSLESLNGRVRGNQRLTLQAMELAVADGLTEMHDRKQVFISMLGCQLDHIAKLVSLRGRYLSLRGKLQLFSNPCMASHSLPYIAMHRWWQSLCDCQRGSRL
jgi:hypothetical protein